MRSAMLALVGGVALGEASIRAAAPSPNSENWVTKAQGWRLQALKGS